MDWAEIIQISVDLDSAVRQRDEKLLAQVAAALSEHQIPLCGGHAQTWFTERNHLTGGMQASCVVCAHLD